MKPKIPNVEQELYLLKQHSPANDAAYDLLDYVAFGYFDGIVLGQPGFFEKEEYSDFDYDCFVLSSFDDEIKKRKKRKKLAHAHARMPDVNSVQEPYFMVSLLQLLPFCNKRCGNMSQHDLLSCVADACELAISKSLPNDDGVRVYYYPYFCYGQVDVVILMQGNSLTYMYSVLERLMHDTRFNENCYYNDSGCACRTDDNNDGICFTSSYSVCGILSAKKAVLESLGINEDASRDKYQEVYSRITDNVHSTDYGEDANVSFAYEIYVKNSAGTKAYLGPYLSDQFSSLDPTREKVQIYTRGVVGNYDYVYSFAPRSKAELAKALFLSASLFDENPFIAGTSLKLQIRINEDDFDNIYSHDDRVNCAYARSRNSKAGENRIFERIFWALHHLYFDDSDADTDVAVAAERLKGAKFVEHNQDEDNWETKEWKSLALELDEMNYFCYQLANSHFSSGIGTMLIQPLKCLYDIYDKVLRYALDLKPGDDEETVNNPLQKNELSLFMDNVNLTLSSLMLSTNSIIETRDFHSCELNSHTKYLVAYYIFMKSVFRSMAPDKSIEVLVTATNDLTTTVKKIMQKYCIYPHNDNPHGLYVLSIPMLHLKNPQVMLPILLHEAGHMRSDVADDDSIKIKKICLLNILADSIAAGLFPEGVIAKAERLNLETLEIIVDDFEEPVVLQSSMFGSYSVAIDQLSKKHSILAYEKIRINTVNMVKTTIKDKLRLDIDDNKQEVLLADYKYLLNENVFFSDKYIDDSIAKIIRECQTSIIRDALDLIPDSYALTDALFVSRNAPLYKRGYRRARIDVTTSKDEDPGIGLENVCFEMMTAANEIYADMYMIRQLNIAKDYTLYLKCFTDESWISLQESLANIFRIGYVLEVFYGQSADAIGDALRNRTKKLSGVDSTSFMSRYNNSLYAEVGDNKNCLTIHDLFLPIFREYIEQLKLCFDREKECDSMKVIKPWRATQRTSGWNKHVVYSLWRDIRNVRS